MTSLKVSVPDTVDAAELERELLTAVADRLRDDHGCALTEEVRPTASGANEYLLRPAGGILIDRTPGALHVKLRGVGADAHDLFTGVSSELEQRHDGLGVEIG
ncbi:hypothetical protein [Mycobacterium sp. Marseille-P9652]|uniref:hypothetical protein n=1 Tax=Mycobacterium sp. Marseille-P9652 TaxID=2654950 RepID=UPI0012E84AFC|nr:hypothetical protein [Mycobacterium sp. Marseille-P9652]